MSNYKLKTLFFQGILTLIYYNLMANMMRITGVISSNYQVLILYVNEPWKLHSIVIKNTVQV